MSKSLGNIIDPVDLIDEYGADALRMAMIVGVGPGSDSNLGTEKVRAYKKFANKLWNIARFVLAAVEDTDLSQKPPLTSQDEQALAQLEHYAQEITEDIEKYNLHLASEKLYHYIWHTFADIIIEERKEVLSGSDGDAKVSAQWTLYTLLTTSLKLLHPFMPFITEEIWQSLPYRTDELLLISRWPENLS
jgi:valyl-tRNA synthetase